MSFIREAVGMPNAFSGGMPTTRNAERRNAETGGTGNESVFEAKNQVTTDSDHVGERLLVGSFEGIMFRVHNKT